MQIVIDISKDRYDEIMSMDWKNGRRFFDEELRAIHDGEALDQEPCGDCVSRQAALESFGLSEKSRKYGGDHSGYETLMKYEIQDILEDLPSVTPQPKMGHWEWNQYDANPKIGNFHCSLCHIIGESYYDYCPGCGAKMSEIPTGVEGGDKE